MRNAACGMRNEYRTPHPEFRMKRRNMKRTIILLFCILITAQLYAASESGFLIIDKRKRTYNMYVPESIKPGASPAVVFVLHGGGGNAKQIEKYTNFSSLADREGFIVVYPQGFDKQWNDGRDVIQSRAHRLKIDDVKFITSIIDMMELKYHIDRKKVFACGISNGGFMSLRLACEIPDKLAAVASVAASMPKGEWVRCNPQSKISVLLINGDADPLVPFNGGYVKIGNKKRGECEPVIMAFDFWKRVAGFTQRPYYTNIVDADKGDQTLCFFEFYKSPDGYETGLIHVKNGGHTWPGAQPYLTEKIVGKVSRDFNATAEIWEFFKRQMAR